MKKIEQLITKLKNKWPVQVLEVLELEPVPAHFRKLKKNLPEVITSILKKNKITRIYRHQAEAIESIRDGNNTAVLSAAASGKTLAYNLPVLESILKNPRTSALYLFPTKALAQDQAQNIRELCREIEKKKKIKITVEIFDGDTPAGVRSRIKKKPPHILISNPDMLHLSLTAHHDQWSGFLKNLKYVVVDEAHYYRGVIGAHLAQVIQRFNRILEGYQVWPQYLVFSATLANGGEFLNKLFGVDFTIVANNGAPAGLKNFVFWRPVASPYQESKRLLLECVQAGLKTIVFTKARKITELIYSWAVSEKPDFINKISAYRAGYLPAERREIEKKLFADELLGVVTTSALELGIDIGGLDVCILVGYPGTLISTWQRIGRVGRGSQPALVILVGLEDALDHYFLEHPRELLDRPLENALVDDKNEIVVAGHLLCAARERPLEKNESLVLRHPEVVQKLLNSGKLFQTGDGRRYLVRIPRPHQEVNLRSIGASLRIKRIDTGKTIGHIEYPKVLHECYPGAIYLHAGNRFQVIELNIPEKFVLVLPAGSDYYTEARTSEEVEIIKILKEKTAPGGRLFWGEIKVTEIVRAYVKKRISDGAVIDEIPLALEPHVFETKSIWLEISDEIKEKVVQIKLDFPGGLHAAEHALIAMLPVFVLCDRFDLGGVSYTFFPETGSAMIFVYDAYPGGIGLAEKAFDIAGQLFESAFKLIKDCRCDDGCPGCVQSPKCGNGNQPLDKNSALVILDFWIKNARNLREVKIPLKSDVPLIPLAAAADIPKKILFFDLETQNLFSEVGGRFPEKLLFSVGVAYDSSEKKYHSFEESQIFQLLDRLISADLVVGFNTHGFDWLVLKKYFQYDLGRLKSFDMLEYIFRKFNFRVSLDALATATLGAGKSADGLQAVAWFREGEVGKVKEYCRHDVEIIKDLYEFGQKFKYLLFERNGQIMRLPVDW